jgi:hypothetical protein
MLSIGHGEFPSDDLPGEETLMVKYLDLLVRPNLLDEKIAFTY